MTLPTLEQLSSTIIALARQELLPRFAQVSREHKADGSIVTEADVTMQDKVESFLKNHWPDIALLGEEMSAEEQAELLQASEWLWCLDPLDGTSNFAAGIPYFCVSLALLHQGKAQLALIYDPVRDECFTAEQGKGAYLNGTKLTTPQHAIALNKGIAVIDLKRLPPQLAASLASQPPFASQRNFGSGALDWTWLAAARYHYYLHGGQKLWDYTAGHLILQEAGGVASTLDGEVIPVQQLVPRSVVAAIEKSAQQQWLNEVRSRLEC